MAKKEGASRGSRVRHVSLVAFLRETGYLEGYPECLFDETKKPEESSIYYILRNDSLMALTFFKEVSYQKIPSQFPLKSLLVYDKRKEDLLLLEKELALSESDFDVLKGKLSSIFASKELDDVPSKKDIDFHDYLIHTGISFPEEKVSSDYLVMDLETNGPRWRVDDLVSLTIYDPHSGQAYHRPLPMEHLDVLLTGYLNHLSYGECRKAKPLSQDELDFLLDHFDMESKKILFVSSTCLWDVHFLSHYQSSHSLEGFEHLSFVESEDLFPLFAEYLKDEKGKERLCHMLSFEKDHGKENLPYPLCCAIKEFRLLLKLQNEPLFFYDKDQLCSYKDDYLIPFDDFYQDDRLSKFAGIKKKPVDGIRKPVLNITFPDNLLEKFTIDANFVISSLFKAFFRNTLKAKEVQNKDFEMMNLRKLGYLGCLYEDRPLQLKDEAFLFRSMKNIDALRYQQLRPYLTRFYEEMKPILFYIRDKIFKSEEVLMHEIVISEDHKIYSVCPFSCKKSILHFVDHDCFSGKRDLYDHLAQKLFFQAKGREVYLVSTLVKDEVIAENRYEVHSLEIRLDEIHFKARKEPHGKGRPRKKEPDYRPKAEFLLN